MGEIIVKVDKETSEMTIEGEGYRGRDCVKDLDKLVEALRGRTIKREGKPEMVRRVNYTWIK